MQSFILPFMFFLRKNNQPGVECCILMPFNKNEARIAVMDKNLMGFHVFLFLFFPRSLPGYLYQRSTWKR